MDKIFEKLAPTLGEDEARVSARELLKFCGDDETKLADAIEQRLLGEPLQYIIGEWDFYNCTFRLGEGVLCPRPETEMIVDDALDFLSERQNQTVLDLCSGSGAIAIAVAKNNSNAKVMAIEKSPVAFEYLKQNIILNKVKNVTPFCDDILTGCDYFFKTKAPAFDLILSNPPYVKTADIDELQLEVQREPRLALDGGEDGLVFYRALAKRWLPCLKAGGKMLVECGEDQADDIIAIFEPEIATSCGKITKKQDFSGLFRVVCVEKLLK